MYQTDFNRKCPVIIGTNVLRIYRDLLSEKDKDMKGIPKEWKVAFKSMKSKCYLVKSVCKKPITVKPNESVMIKGCVTGLPNNNMTMVCKSCDNIEKFTVCPRYISAKPLSLRRGTVLCNLQEVKVVDNLLP